MIKLIIFSVILVVVVSSFTINLGFFVNGFNNINSFFEQLPELLNYIKDTFYTIINMPTLNIIILTGLAFVAIDYGLSLLGDEKND